MRRIRMKVALPMLVALLAVGAVIYYVAFAATVVCPTSEAPPTACGAAQGTTDNADTILCDAAGSAVTDLAGDDVIYGSDRADTVPCNAAGDCDGNDVIFGRGGDDVFSGGACANTGNQTGNNIMYGNDGDDDVCGGPGNDFIDCGPGADDCNGGAGNDIIIGGKGTDAFTAANNDGDDIFIIRAGDTGAADEDLQCGDGTDTVIFLGFGNQAFTFPVADPVTGYSYTNTTADCEILIGG